MSTNTMNSTSPNARTSWVARLMHAFTLVLLGVLLTGCERPSPETVQSGYRGTGMVQVYNARLLEAKADKNQPPFALPSPGSDGPKASQVYKNVRILGNLSVGEFNRLMVSMSSWVAPQEGCAYCHQLPNFELDTKYTKVVARRMIEMTRHINSDWKPHVAQTGVTCYTCHRGEPVPSAIWFKSNPQPYGSNFMGDKAGQNTPSPVVNMSSLPNDPFTPFLLDDQKIRVNGPTALPSGNRQSIKQAEWTYGLMTHMSNALGVNCTYCHNTQSFQNWTHSPPQRTTAWHGIRMARDLNQTYMESLSEVFPEHRKGPTGDVAKLNCATCHQGAYKPLYGAPMAKDFPELFTPALVSAKVATK